MIALILGTSEGKKLLSLINQYSDDVAVSTATNYGGELLKDYKYKVLNTVPLGFEELKVFIKINKVKALVDASHPYAKEVSENSIRACAELNIEYIRYERPSIADEYKENIIKVKDYEELYSKLREIEGTILNTTGSNNVDKFMNMNLKNRIIHRVLPSTKVMEKCFGLGVKTEDIIAIKGPISYGLNLAFIDEYAAKAIVLKDSGVEGGTKEKIEAAVARGIKIFLIDRLASSYEDSFDDLEKVVEYLKIKRLI